MQSSTGEIRSVIPRVRVIPFMDGHACIMEVNDASGLEFKVLMGGGPTVAEALANAGKFVAALDRAVVMEGVNCRRR